MGMFCVVVLVDFCFEFVKIDEYCVVFVFVFFGFVVELFGELLKGDEGWDEDEC